MNACIFFTELENSPIESYISINGIGLRAASTHAKLLSEIGQFEFAACILVVKELSPITELIKAIRVISKKVFIEIICDKTSDYVDVCNTYEIGADDVFCYPYNLNVIIQALKRRISRSDIRVKSQNDLYVIGKYKFIAKERSLQYGDEAKAFLSDIESKILHLLLHFRGNLVTRELILKSIWRDDNYYAGRSLDVYMTKIRKMFDKDENIQILSVRGKGYCLTELD